MITINNFIEIFNEIAKEKFNYNKNIPIEFMDMGNIYGVFDFTLKFNNDGYGKIIVDKFTFSNKVLDGSLSENQIINIIKHELIHWYISNQWNNNLKDYISLIIPHGFWFIKEAKKCNLNNYKFFILGGFLENIQWKFVSDFVIGIINKRIKISPN